MIFVTNLCTFLSGQRSKATSYKLELIHMWEPLWNFLPLVCQLNQLWYLPSRARRPTSKFASRLMFHSVHSCQWVELKASWQCSTNPGIYVLHPQRITKMEKVHLGCVSQLLSRSRLTLIWKINTEGKKTQHLLIQLPRATSLFCKFWVSIYNATFWSATRYLLISLLVPWLQWYWWLQKQIWRKANIKS